MGGELYVVHHPTRMKKNCISCRKNISPKASRCRSCNLSSRNKDPEYIDKMRKGIKKAWKEGKYDIHKISKFSALPGFSQNQIRCKYYRDKVFEKLGDQCNQCGFSDKRALQLDHVNGGGTKERKKKSFMLYKLAIEDINNNYQILCANCNWIKRYERQEI